MSEKEIQEHITMQKPLWTLSPSDMPMQVIYEKGFVSSNSYIRGMPTGFLVVDYGRVKHYYESEKSCAAICLANKKAQMKNIESDIAALQTKLSI